MFFFDPDEGKRRRALVRDKAVSAARHIGDFFDKAARDIRHRAHGILAEAGAKLGGERPSDDVLVARVASKLGRVISHPRAIGVTAEDGRVFLTGPILASEVERLISTIRSVRGVLDIENRLDVHESADGIPDLQGGVERPGERSPLFQRSLSPGMRLLAVAAGAGILVASAIRRGLLGVALGGIGAGVLLRGIINTSPRNRLERGRPREESAPVPEASPEIAASPEFGGAPGTEASRVSDDIVGRALERPLPPPQV